MSDIKIKPVRKPRTKKATPVADVNAVIKKVKETPVQEAPEVAIPKVRASRKPKVAPVAPEVNDWPTQGAAILNVAPVAPGIPVAPTKEEIASSIDVIISRLKPVTQKEKKSKNKIINYGIIVIGLISLYFIGAYISKEFPFDNEASITKILETK